MTLAAAKFPKRLEIELASACNLRCTYCPRRYVDDLSGYMKFDLFKKIIDEAMEYPETVIVLHRRGESMLNPKFSEILNFIAGKFQEVQMATNATLLTEDKFAAIVNGLDFLSFSLDSPDNYNKTRVPAKYDEVEANILRFLEYNKGRVRTQASMVKIESTPESEVELFKNIWKDRVDRVRIYEEHSADGKFGSLKAPRRDRKPCVMPFYEILVYDDGKVGRCNHDWNGSPTGDLNISSIKEVWNSETYRNLREQHNSLLFTDPVCSTCDSWYPEIAVQGTGEVLEDANKGSSGVETGGVASGGFGSGEVELSDLEETSKERCE